jgi:RNAse (barnase) inhibitor barstar
MKLSEKISIAQSTGLKWDELWDELMTDAQSTGLIWDELMTDVQSTGLIWDELMTDVQII